MADDKLVASPLTVDFRNESIGTYILRDRDFPERVPERAFNTNAAVMAVDGH